jgi:hypothetical protein
MLFLAGCGPRGTQADPPVASPSASAFLLDSTVFPEGWVGDTSKMSETLGDRDFSKPGVAGHAFQEIYRYPNDWSASQKYKVYLEGEINVRKFTPPPEITFRSKIADEYYFACGVDLIPSCAMVARYHNYFVFFYFDLYTKEQPEGLTYAEIEHVLEALEARVTNLFSVPTETTPIK